MKFIRIIYVQVMWYELKCVNMVILFIGEKHIYYKVLIMLCCANQVVCGWCIVSIRGCTIST